MRKKSIVRYFVSILLCMTCLTGCGADQKSSEVVSSDEQLQEEAEEKLPEYVIVSTEYGDLYYQYQWKEFMKTEQTKVEDTIVVDFRADIQQGEYQLFRITIGGEQEEVHGKLTDSKGTERNVYVSMNEIVMPEDMSEGEQNRLYAMQEEINYVLAHLK